jgi:hypothetical protein
VHHIRMWAHGGLTEDENLITLCHTCHDGLSPHEDWGLFRSIAPNGELFSVGEELSELTEGTMRYRKIVAKVLESLSGKEESNRRA